MTNQAHLEQAQPLVNSNIGKQDFPPQVFKARFPRDLVGASEADALYARWEREQGPAQIANNPIAAVVAQPLTDESWEQFSAILASDGNAPAEMLRQGMGPSEVAGVLFSALTVLSYIRASSNRRLAPESPPADSQDKIPPLSDAYIAAFASAGLKITEDDLQAFTAVLVSDDEKFDSFLRVRGTASPANGAFALDGPPQFTVVAASGTTSFPGLGVAATTRSAAKITSLVNCSQPLAQGSYTSHFSDSFALSFSVTYPCGVHWVKTGRWPWNGHFETSWCTSSFTIASVNFSLDMTLGYEVDCCGMSAWGSVTSQACGSIAGFTRCASCTATLSGIAGLSSSPSGSLCTYGLGVVATVTCKFANITLYSHTWPFGWNFQGVCRPQWLGC